MRLWDYNVEQDNEERLQEFLRDDDNSEELDNIETNNI